MLKKKKNRKCILKYYFSIAKKQPPKPKTKWNGIKDGSKEGSPCLQLNPFNEPEVIGSEDCLWLNVYTTNTTPNLKPVLVWIYGGGFSAGTASKQAYSPEYMMDHDIVMVSIQYRVGPYGFLSTGDEAAPGNYGLLDQNLALKWIQQNIAKFGGDPNQVTVSGHSAGSASAHMHMLSPMSKGLVHRIISLSGTGVNYWANRNTEHGMYARKMGKLFDCPTEERYLISFYNQYILSTS